MKNSMKYNNYYGSVQLDEDEPVFHGKIEFIRALVTYEATTAKSLKKAFHDAVDDYLKTCKEGDITPEVSFKGSLNVRIGPDLHKKIALAAENEHISINKFIQKMLTQAMRHH